MRLAPLALVLVAGIAAADDAATPVAVGTTLVVAPDTHGEHDVAAALLGTRVQACAKQTHTVLVWVVFDRGKVTAADAAGSGDRKLDACVARAAKTARLGTKAHVAAAVELVLREPMMSLTGKADPSTGLSDEELGAFAKGQHGGGVGTINGHLRGVGADRSGSGSGSAKPAKP